MAKRFEIIGKKAFFTMSIKGGDLPSNFEVEIEAEMDFEGASQEQLLKCCASGQSARVALQSQLRKKPVAALRSYADNGLKVKFTDIISGDIAKPTDKLLALSKEDFVEIISEEFGISMEQAEKIYNQKHEIE